jgi:hypothetical protein
MHELSRIKYELASRILYSESCGKDQEREITTTFLQRLMLKFSNLTDSERPDFFCEVGNQKIGIELTVLSADSTKKGSIERTTFQKWREISNTLCVALNAYPSGLCQMYGSVFFNKPSAKVVFELPIDDFVNQIKQLLESCEVSETGEKIYADQFASYPVLQEFVEHLYLKRIPSESNIL